MSLSLGANTETQGPARNTCAAMLCALIGMSPKATNSIAGGNAAGTGVEGDSTLNGSKITAGTRSGCNLAMNRLKGHSTPSGSESVWWSLPVALPPAIEFVAFGDSPAGKSPTRIPEKQKEINNGRYGKKRNKQKRHSFRSEV